MNAFVIHTPGDFRPTLYSNGFSQRVLASLIPENEPILEKALDQIFKDLTYLDTSDPNLVSAYVKRIEEPLRVVDGLGLEILALATSSEHVFADGTMSDWIHVYYLTISNESFFRVGEAVSTATVHKFDPGCKEAMNALMVAALRNDSISTSPESAIVVTDYPGNVPWCSSCCKHEQPLEQSERATPSLERPGSSADQPLGNRDTAPHDSRRGIVSESLRSRALTAIRSFRSGGTSLTPQFTRELRAIDLRARQIAIRYQHERVDLAHFLLTFIEDPDESFRSISTQDDPGLKATRSKVKSFLDGLPKVSAKMRRGRDLRYTRRLEVIVDHAHNDALRVGDKRISPARLFLALASEDFYSEAERGAISERLLSQVAMTPRQIERKLLGREAGGSADQLQS